MLINREKIKYMTEKIIQKALFKKFHSHIYKFINVYFFENEKYEFILSSAGHFSTNYNVVIIDKAKNTIIKIIFAFTLIVNLMYF